MALIVASQSRYRLELLQDAGIEFRAVQHRCDERSVPVSGQPGEVAVALARCKAKSVSADCDPDDLILGMDQLCVVGSDENYELLHQPGEVERAVQQLASLSGGTHRLVNGLALLQNRTNKIVSAVEEHRVVMRSFTEEQAREYVEEVMPLDCAGSYRIECDRGLVETIEGSGIHGVIGAPLHVIRWLLKQVPG